MDRGLIDSFEIKFKSAFRNLKSAILLCAMLFALCLSRPGAAADENSTDRICGSKWHCQSELAQRCISARAERSRLHRGEKHPDRESQRRGKAGLDPRSSWPNSYSSRSMSLSSTNPAVIRTAKQATKTIPIVMVSSADPVATGIVDSLGTPGWEYHRIIITRS